MIVTQRSWKEICRKQLLCKEQIGFMEGLGCEVNLLRLRQRCNDIKKSK